MADTFPTLADLVKLNDKNANDLGVSDLFDDSPLLKALSATVASNGTDHKYLKESGAPVVGFRAANAGRENGASADTLVTINLKILDASFAIDKALADSYHKGADACIASHAKRHLKAALFGAERQIINGTGVDSSGFTGLINASTLDGLADDYVVNATGSTADTGSSVYLIRTNDDGTDVQVVVGNEGMIQIDDSVVTSIPTFTATAPGEGDTSLAPTGRFPAYYTPILGWMGLQIGGVASVVRICNLTAQSGKGLTDALISQALAKFPASRQPNLIVMGRRSRQQLQASRTATNATGAPAPMPMESFNVPIIVTDAITATEAIVA